MRIADSVPKEPISHRRYQAEKEEFMFRPLNYLLIMSQMEEVIPVRLIRDRQALMKGGLGDTRYAGNFPVRIMSLEPMRSRFLASGAIRVELVHAEDESIRTDRLFIKPSGILHSRGRAPNWFPEEGYFPIDTESGEENTEKWDESEFWLWMGRHATRSQPPLVTA